MVTRRCPALAVLSIALALLLGAVLAGSTAETRQVLGASVGHKRPTALPVGYNSQSLQLSRSSVRTRPATWLQNAIGINFNVMPEEAQATARLLRQSGFRRARIEFPWGAMSFSDPSKISDPAEFRIIITAFRDNGIRPLILLNANHVEPGPETGLTLTLRARASRGARRISLTTASGAQVVPGLTGINVQEIAAGELITKVGADGVAALSRPLPVSLRAGPVAATTLRYAPFAPPYLADGAPNPRFQQTLSGWLTYVKSVTQFVRDAYGSDHFDVEVWNELSFGSDFLNERNYFSPVPDPASKGSVDNALLKRTIQMLKRPVNGLTGVRIGDGFTNETPFASGATVPAGTDAVDKHVYPFSADYPGLGRVFMPESFLTGSARPRPTIWITEGNLDADQARRNGLPGADVPEFQAKAALRFFTSYASVGAQAVDLFAAKVPLGDGPSWQLISQGFFNAVDADPSSYPISQGGRTMQAVRRLTGTLAGDELVPHPRQISLQAIASNKDVDQFAGIPTLYNREVLAFFPFQVSQDRFVSAVYVMTHDLTHYYAGRPEPGSTHYDLPAQTLRLTINGVDAARATVSLIDPLIGTRQVATIVSRSGSRIVVQLRATDSPRMLTIDDGPEATTS